MKIDSKIAIVIIATVSFVFLREMILFDKLPESADMFHRMPLDRWAEEYTSLNDDMPQWYPHLFGGMPSYGGFIYAPADPFRKVFDFLGLGWGVRYWIHFIIAGAGMVVYLRRRRLSEIASLFGALTFSLSPYLFGLINAGHPAKLYAIAFIPWVVLSAERLIEKQTVKSALFLALVTALQLWTKHVQIVYYTWMLIVFLWLWREGLDWRRKEYSLKRSGSRAGFMVVAIALSGLLVADPYLPIYEFQGHSTRGAASALDVKGETEKGTSWEYATQWSFHPKETVSLVYPYFYGLQNFPTRDLKSQAYWGFMPFTQSTHYMGLLVLLLAVLGFFIRKPDSSRLSMGVASVIILVIGFGVHFPVLFWPLFKLAPMFGRFRIPSMIYILLPFTFSVLSSTTLHNLTQTFKSKADKRDEIRKKVVLVFGVIIGLSLVLFVIGGDIISFSRLGESARYQPAMLEQLKEARIDLFKKGALMSFVLSSAGLAVLWLALRGTLRASAVGICFVVITLVDLWIVNGEFIHLKQERAIKAGYRPTKEVEFLLKNRGLHRILPVEQFNTNWYAYFGLSSVGGYRPVKLRVYQDLLDAQALNSPAVQDMLNVRYVVTQRAMSPDRFELVFEDRLKVYENRTVLPKAWFVEHVEAVGTKEQSLASILKSGFDPARMAYVLDYGGVVGDAKSDGRVAVVKYSENEIVLETEIESDAFLVLSEIYYGPGWRASIDESETQIFRTNHVLRGVNIPPGKHTVTFNTDDAMYRTASSISLTTMTLTILVLLLFYRQQILDLPHRLRRRN